MIEPLGDKSWLDSQFGHSKFGCDYQFNKGTFLSRSLPIIASVLAWVIVWAFWLFATRSQHPSWTLALIVTTSLVLAFAAATYIHHYCLLPKLARDNSYVAYRSWLLAVMISLTAVALTIIRISYLRLHGPDADPFGAYKHFAIDLFGMLVHVAVAYVAVRYTPWNRLTRSRSAAQARCAARHRQSIHAKSAKHKAKSSELLPQPIKSCSFSISQ